MKAIAVVGVGTAALLAVVAIFFASDWSLNEAIVNQGDISICSPGKFEIESRSARTEGGASSSQPQRATTTPWPVVCR